MDKLEFMPSKFSEKELELIELLKKKEMTRGEIIKAGFPFSETFLDRCCNHGVAIYESDEIGIKQSYGILKV
jgi:hypothetical protein